MTNAPDVTVVLDDRIRLLSALLAATDYHERAQARKPHGAHAHARATRKLLADWKAHEAVQIVQSLFDAGMPPDALFALAIEPLPDWVPPRLPAALDEFYLQTGLADFWASEDGAWQKSASEAQKLFEHVRLKPLLLPFFGEIGESLIFAPNISYPTDIDIGIGGGGYLICIAPPRLAWGDNPPWPFDEDPAHVYRAALGQYARLLLAALLREDVLAEAAKTPLPASEALQAAYPTWEAQFVHLFASGITAMFLEDCVSRMEVDAFMLMARKAYGMALLPGVVSVLRRYVSEKEAGQYDNLLDFLPVFGAQLRAALR